MDENMSVELMYDELKEQAIATFGPEDAKIIDNQFLHFLIFVHFLYMRDNHHHKNCFSCLQYCVSSNVF